MSGNSEDLRKTFADLQIKYNDQLRQLNACKMQSQNKYFEKRRSDMTLQELSSLEPATPTYKMIGKIFLRKEKQELQKNLMEDIQKLEQDLNTLESTETYLRKSVGDNETSLKELVPQLQKLQTSID